MYPIENVVGTDTTQQFVNKYNNLANHNRASWRTLAFAISASEAGTTVLVPAQANTVLLLPANPHGFLVYSAETMDESDVPIIALETHANEADVCPETTLSNIPFEVVELNRNLPLACVDISIKPLSIRVERAAPIPDVVLHFFLHVLFVNPELYARFSFSTLWLRRFYGTCR